MRRRRRGTAEERARRGFTCSGRLEGSRQEMCIFTNLVIFGRCVARYDAHKDGEGFWGFRRVKNNLLDVDRLNLLHVLVPFGFVGVSKRVEKPLFKAALLFHPFAPRFISAQI